MKNKNSKTLFPSNMKPIEYDSDVLCYRVLDGTVYLFAVETMENGLDSGRNQIATYKKNDIIICLPPSHKTRFILTGFLNAEIESIDSTFFDTEEGKLKLKKGLENIYSILNRGLSSKADFSEILKSSDKAKAIKDYAESLSLEISAIVSADNYDEEVNFLERQKSQDEAFSASLSDLASVLKKRRKVFHTESSSSFIRAAMIVNNYNGVQIKALDGKNYDAADALSELAKDNNLRIRLIKNSNKWWKQDNGALFAYYVEDPNDENSSVYPAALIPEKTTGYSCTVPDLEFTKIVDEEVASHIQKTTYMFYKPFSDKVVTLKELFKFSFSARKMSSDIVIILVLGLLSTIVGLLIPKLTQVFTDSIIPQAAKNMAVQLSLLVLLCVISSTIFDFIKSLGMIRMQTRTNYLLESAAMDRLLKLPVGFFKNYNAGKLGQKTMAVSQLNSIVFETVLSSVMTFVFTFVYLFQLFKYSSYLLKWGLLFCLISVVVVVLVMILQYKINRNIISTNTNISGLLFQFITGVNKLNMTNSEKRAFSIWENSFAKQQSSKRKSNIVNIIYSTFSTVFPSFITLAFYGIFMAAVKNGKMELLSTGSFLAFLSSFSVFQSSLISMASVLTTSINAIPIYEQARTILDAEPEITESKPAVSSLSGLIDISHISFRYNPDSPLVLKDVSLRINPGEFVAIVGGSGSGKSTLLRVLLGFEKPETGTVFYDHHDLSSLDVGSVRRNMGVVLQNSTVMQGSIFSNIVGSSALTIDDAWKAAEMAGLAEDIRGMPMEMHTMVTSGGGTLSGGQKQRLIIARAIARRPNILIFDEATSALDNKTQAEVSRSLESLKVTRIVIAHRLSTIINADKIYVLNNGVIEESGTYKELINNGGFFSELAKRQQI